MTAGPVRNPVCEAVCIAAGWPYCAEHDSRASACDHLHAQPEPRHEYWCAWPNGDCTCPCFLGDGKSR